MPQYSNDGQHGGFLPQIWTTSLVAAGSNQESPQGSPTETLSGALNSLTQRGGVIRSVSRFFATPCFPVGAGPDFVNAVFRLDLKGDALRILGLLHDVEAEFGRLRDRRWGQRTLDLDLLAVGQLVVPDARNVRQWIGLSPEQQLKTAPEQLVLPHPRLHDRAFVLVPLLDIAPQWVHPVLGKSVRQMHDALPDADRNAVKPLVIQPEHK